MGTLIYTTGPIAVAAGTNTLVTHSLGVTVNFVSIMKNDVGANTATPIVVTWNSNVATVGAIGGALSAYVKVEQYHSIVA